MQLIVRFAKKCKNFTYIRYLVKILDVHNIYCNKLKLLKDYLNFRKKMKD